MDDVTTRITLTLIGPATLAVFGSAFVGAWAIERKRHYLLYLAVACALFVIGACVQIVYWPRDPGLNAVISCAFYNAAVLLASEGLLRRAGKRMDWARGLLQEPPSSGLSGISIMSTAICWHVSMS